MLNRLIFHQQARHNGGSSEDKFIKEVPVRNMLLIVAIQRHVE